MKNETIKTLRAKAEETLAAGVANRNQLVAAVPGMVALQSAVKAAEVHLKETKAVLAALVGACSDYAHAHPEHVFGDTFSVSPIGVESGDVTIEGRAYHFSWGFDGYRRDDPTQKITQEFLAALPEGWAKKKLELDTTAINHAKPSDDDLAAAGLERKPKPQWCAM